MKIITNKILDIGCGLGANIERLEKKGLVTGIDISLDFVKYCQKKFPNSNFILMNSQNLDFPDKHFNEIHCYDVLEHVDNLSKTLTEIKRVLKTNGKLYVDIPNYYSELFLEKLNTNYATEVHHKRKFTYEEINRILNKYQFKIYSAKATKAFDNLYWTYNFLTKKSIKNQQGEISETDAVNELFAYYIKLIYDNKNYYQPDTIPFYRDILNKTQKILYSNPEDIYFLLKLFNDIGNHFFPKTISMVCLNEIKPNNDLRKTLNSSHNKSISKIISKFQLETLSLYNPQLVENFNKINTELAEKNTQIVEYVNTLNKINTELAEKNTQIVEYVNTLNKIYNSKMWKMLGFYKKTIEIPKNILKKFIPISIRKKAKYQLENKFISNTEINIPLEILEEWQNYKRQNDNFDLFNFCVIAWDFRYQRPQQLAKHIAQRGNRVFYIKNEFLPHTNEKDIFAPIKVEKKDFNVYEVTLSASRNIFIYNDKPSEKDKKIMLASLKTIIDKANIINPIAKIDHPFWKNIIDEFGVPYIYDCMDNHQGFAETGKENKELEQKIFKDSPKTIVTSNYLNCLAKKYNAKNISIIKNAGDYDHFNIVNKNLEIPEDMRKIKNEIIGYYGAIAEWFDTEILEDIALNNPDKSIVLIGNVTNNKVNLLSKKYKNIILLGEKSYSILPNYLKQFDVCIIPFVINELIKATHPVKIFEFLAAGKPVVVTKMPEIFDLKNVIYFAKKSNFNEQVQKALKNKDKNIAKRQEVAQKNTWITRANDLIKEINKIIFPKVSLILLSYNSPEMLKETIESVLNRSFYPNFELITVDNNSDKETINVINSYRTNKKIKIILNKENYGFAKGNNIGTEKATGDYIILINNDVLVTPGWISRLIFHANKPNIGLVGPVTNSIGNEAKINIEYNPNNILDLESKAKKYTSSHWNETLYLNNIAAFCWIISKKIFNKIGNFDNRFGRGMFEDDDYCLRIRKAGLKIIITDDAFIHHYGGASFKQIQTQEYKNLFNKNKLIFEKKWNIKWLPHKYRS